MDGWHTQIDTEGKTFLFWLPCQLGSILKGKNAPEKQTLSFIVYSLPKELCWTNRKQELLNVLYIISFLKIAENVPSVSIAYKGCSRATLWNIWGHPKCRIITAWRKFRKHPADHAFTSNPVNLETQIYRSTWVEMSSTANNKQAHFLKNQMFRTENTVRSSSM